LVKASPRWYWTLRALMNSRAPISGVRQAVASQPRHVDLLGGQLAGSLDGALASDLAGGQPLTPRRSPNACTSIRVQHVASGGQLLPRGTMHRKQN
jgi:hypothetical protein